VVNRTSSSVMFYSSCFFSVTLSLILIKLCMSDMRARGYKVTEQCSYYSREGLVYQFEQCNCCAVFNCKVVSLLLYEQDVAFHCYLF